MKCAAVPGHAADHSPPSSAEGQECMELTSTPQYVFMAWCNFTLLTFTVQQCICIQLDRLLTDGWPQRQMTSDSQN
jgi:hypothetical protein